MSRPNSPVAKRAAASLGSSSAAIYRMVARVLAERHSGGGTLLDVGCGQGELNSHVAPFIDKYIGADALRYDGFPPDHRFLEIDFDAGRVPLPDASAEVVAAVETIEHLENPRAFVRELTRLTKPGGLVLITTPNQLSLLSKLTLLTKNQFNAFQEAPGLYPAHLTALLEIDLRRIAAETGLIDSKIVYSDHGRIPGGAGSWPNLPFFRGHRFSDNLLLSARIPAEPSARPEKSPSL